MTKQNASSTELKPESTTQPQSSIEPCSSQETLTMMRRMEAREWIRRYREKVKTDGQMQARGWWDGVIGDIEKIRGKEAATELRYWMNQEK